MQITTDGLILKRQDYKENDKLLTVLTRELGVVFALARGARRISSPMAASTNQFAFANFVFFCNNDKYIINTADSINLFFGLNNNITKLSLASYFCELTSVFAPENMPAEQYLKLILNAFFMLENDKRPLKQIKSVFELRLLSISGFMPDLVACRNCMDYCSALHSFFDFSSSSILCCNCHGGVSSSSEFNSREIELSPDTLNAMRHVIYSEDNKIYNFSLGDDNLRLLNEISEKYLLFCIDKKPKTLDFLTSVL